MKSIQAHLNDIQNICEQLKNATGEVALLRSGTCCSRSFDYKKSKTLIDISALNQIIEINQEENTIFLEPLVTMRAIVKATLAKGLIVPVITELAQMTVGGAIQGLGGESSSFKYGFLDDSVLSYEIILGDGSLITASPTQHADLFNAIPGSFGSFGIVVGIKLKLIPASRYVHITYHKLTDISQVQAIFSQVKEAKNIDFIECVALNKNDFRLIKGVMQNQIGLRNWLFNRCKQTRFYHRWFFDHLINKSEINGKEQYLSYEDYVFRWNRGNFWTGVIALKQKYPSKVKQLLLRIFFGWLLDSKRLYDTFYSKSLQEREKGHFYQDLLVPLKELDNFFNYLHESVNAYPVWMIPIKAPQQNKLFSISKATDDYYADLGIWSPLASNQNFVEVNRAVEQFLQQTGGRKWLWGQGYYDEKEFWTIYNKPEYETLRKKYKADGRFITIYLKVTELYRNL